MGVLQIFSGRLWNGTAFEANQEICREIEQERDIVVHLSEQDMILPGVIDTHIHAWTPCASKKLGVPTDRIYYKGVVAARQLWLPHMAPEQPVSQRHIQTNRQIIYAFAANRPDRISPPELYTGRKCGLFPSD